MFVCEDSRKYIRNFMENINKMIGGGTWLKVYDK